MQCPVCDVTLIMSDRKGIEIDYCPRCRGVWLDRGELDKIIERSSSYKKKDRYHEDRERYHNPEYKKKNDYKYKSKRRRESILEEIFDIFD